MQSDAVNQDVASGHLQFGNVAVPILQSAGKITLDLDPGKIQNSVFRDNLLFSEIKNQLAFLSWLEPLYFFQT